MPGVSGKNVPAVRVFQVVICHASCENREFYGGLVIPFPAFSVVFPVFGLRAEKFRTGFFPCFCCFLVPVQRSSLPFPFFFFCCFLVPVQRSSLPFPFTHVRMCAHTRSREIHNVVPFLSVLESVKKRSPATVLFPAIYKKSSKNLQKSIA